MAGAGLSLRGGPPAAGRDQRRGGGQGRAARLATVAHHHRGCLHLAIDPAWPIRTIMTRDASSAASVSGAAGAPKARP